jgi:hypothetical protein
MQPRQENATKSGVWLFGILMLVALAVSACGRSARSLEAEMDMATAERATSKHGHVVTTGARGSRDILASPFWPSPSYRGQHSNGSLATSPSERD